MVNVETEKKVKASMCRMGGKESPGFIKGKQWREMDTEDILKSVEVAARVIEDDIDIEGEALDEPTEVARVAQLLDLSAVFQELAIMVLKGELEKFAHL